MDGRAVESTSFEERIQQRLQEELLGPGATRPLPPTITIDEVRVEGRYPDAEIVVLFRDRERPECRFGYRWRFADEEEAWFGDGDYFIPMLTWAYLTGLIEADGSPYPGDCIGGEVTWFSY